MDNQESIIKLEEENNRLKRELEELRAAVTGIAEPSKDMLFRVFHSSHQMMALLKLDTSEFIEVNSYFLGILGYERSQVIGKTPDDIGLFTGIDDSNKYIKLLSKLKKVKDYLLKLRTREGEEKTFLFSAETVQFDDDFFIMTLFTPFVPDQDNKIKDSHGSVLEEIFNTVSSYLALFRIGSDKRIYIIDINSKVEEVEFIDKNDIIGKCLDETPLARREKLVELLHHLRITGEAHKLASSAKGDDSEGFYMGFILTTGNILITWEPGYQQKTREDISRKAIIFKEFAEMLPEMIYEVDLNGKILFGNQRALDFFGYTREDLNKGVLISDIFPESYQRMIENLKAIKSPEEVSSNEYLAKKKDSTFVPILTHSFATFYKGKITGYRGSVTDISGQKRFEEQILREKAFLMHIIDFTPEAIAITDSSRKITMINKEFSSLFGYKSEEVVGRKIDDIIVPDDLQNEFRTIENLTSKHHKVEKQTVRKDKFGNKINVSLIATSIQIQSETEAYLAIYRDITTERKNQLLQEILYHISSAALKETDIKEIYPVIVHEISKIWDTNNFFIALYDKNSETLSLPFFADEKDSFHEIPAKKTITGYVIKNNKPVLLKDNDLHMLEESGDIDLVGTPCKVWMGVPLRVEESTIGVMCLQDYNDEDKFTQDDLYILDFIANQIAIVIQRKMIMDNLIIARQKAEEAAQSKQLFMSTMSHEIRTPLNEVIGITNLLLQGNPREDQMDYIKTLRFSGNHLLTLVNDVLDYNKMESGKIIFEQTLFNLDDFMDEIMRSYSFRSKAKNIGFDIMKEGSLPSEVIGDPIRLNQILSNLLSNALKFTNHGGITVTIREIDRIDNHSRLAFSVKDTGIGIPKEKHSTIFESFTQASPDTTRHFGGTGLGLAICKKLIELQGGTISIDSEPNRGSIFTFTITFTISEKKTKQPSAETAETYIGLEGKRILVAEDNKINFFVANKFLIGWGVTVTHAENGLLALEKLEHENFDLVLMDLHMPVMDGIEATRIIRKSENPRIRNIPIVALTAAIMSENHDKIDELNINDYVLKPFKPHDLFDRILKHIK